MINRFICVLFLSSSFAFGQLVTSGSSPSALVQNVLLGPGVTVSNISYSGSSVAIGSFTANGTNLGISSGVIMTTGTIFNTGQGPHGPNNKENAGIDNNFGGYPLLSSIVGTATYNASVLEFDFVPFSDTVRFKYVFGSEEYIEYVGTQFNDVFGFYISGPGISGTQNIARLPGTGQEVTINNVNHISNSAYYVSNSGGATIQYDGFTHVLEAVSRVQCGQTYHLIIALADVGDGIYDSGIFLEAQSLRSNAPVNLNYSLSTKYFTENNAMAEGCTSTSVTLTRGPQNINEALFVPINVLGTATEGVDYSNIPNSVTFAPGQTTVQFNIQSFNDMLSEGDETIDLEFMLLDACGNQAPLHLELLIRDIQPVDVTVEDVSVICPGDDATLQAVVTGGLPPYTYLWNTSATTPSITVNPASTTSYTVQVTDNCTAVMASDNATVTVPVLSPITLSVSNDITEICPYVPADLTVSASGGGGSYTYEWLNNGLIIGTGSNVTVVPSASTSYIINVQDNCGNEASEDILYNITSPPLLLEMTPTQEICPWDSVQIGVTASGGYGQYQYFWPHSSETSPQIWVQPLQTTNYLVNVADECQTFSVQGRTTVVVRQPIANFEISSSTLFNGLPVTFANQSVNTTQYDWDFGDGNGSTQIHPSNVYIDPGNYVVTLIAEDDLGCSDTIAKPIIIGEEYYLYIPNTFTPNESRINDRFSAVTVGITDLTIWIYNRWGESVFYSEDLFFEWDGSFKDIKCQDGTYTYKVIYFTPEGEEKEVVGHVNLVR